MMTILLGLRSAKPMGSLQLALQPHQHALAAAQDAGVRLHALKLVYVLEEAAKSNVLAKIPKRSGMPVIGAPLQGDGRVDDTVVAGSFQLPCWSMQKQASEATAMPTALMRFGLHTSYQPWGPGDDVLKVADEDRKEDFSADTFSFVVSELMMSTTPELTTLGRTLGPTAIRYRCCSGAIRCNPVQSVGGRQAGAELCSCYDMGLMQALHPCQLRSRVA